MSVVTEKPISETRPILAPTGNRVRAVEKQRRKAEKTKKQAQKPRRVVVVSSAKPAAAFTADSYSESSSSSSSSCGFNVKESKSECPRKMVVKISDGVNKPAKIAPDGTESVTVSRCNALPLKRCHWITPNSEPLYSSFHDEEWGAPVHDDTKLFELLILSQALAELSWPVILSRRAIFRKLFDDFDPSSVANLNEERLLSIRVHGNTLLSEPKLWAVVENAKQLLKIQQEFGSFSTYCWNFVNQKPIKSGFRQSRQVPTKTPKSELISKDLMQRGFRCVGPTVVYSFMQVSGIVNNHLLTCFRYNEVSHDGGKNPTKESGEKQS